MKKFLYCCLAVYALLFAFNASGQILNPKKLLEKKANKVIEKKTDQAIDSILDKKEKPKETAPQNDTPQTAQEEKKSPVADIHKKDSVPALELYSKYDFVPGERVIFLMIFPRTI